jgi:hypothetical protein
VTVLSLLSLRTPADFADWYRLGAQYVHGVADTMGFDLGRFSETYPRAVESLRVGSDLAPRAARSVAADLLADATYAEPYREWMPLWYELGLLPFNRLAERRLRRAARTVASGADAGPVSAPSAGPRRVRRRPDRHRGRRGPRVRGAVRPADALPHLEWFVHVARESGVAVPRLSSRGRGGRHPPVTSATGRSRRRSGSSSTPCSPTGAGSDGSTPPTG